MTPTKFKKQILFSSILVLTLFSAHVSFAKNDAVENRQKNAIEKTFERVQSFGQKITEKKAEQPKTRALQPGVLADDRDMKKGSVCFQIEKAATQAEEKIVTQSAKLSTQRLEALQKKEMLAQTIDDKREVRRNAWDENFNERFTALMQNAKTPAQKQAVENFQSVVQQAITDRRNQIDAATNDFRMNMNAVVTTQKTKIESAVNTYQEAVRTAAGTAKANCAATTATRDDFKTALQNARKNFEANRMDIEKGKDITQTLTAAHAAAIQKANSDFAATIQKAAATLKTAF